MIEQGKNRKYLLTKQMMTEHGASFTASNGDGNFTTILSLELIKTQW